MWPNSTETADLVTFTEEILNGKFYFLCSDVKTVLKLLLTIPVVIDSTASVQETRNWEKKWSMAENLRLKETEKDFEMINKKSLRKKKSKAVQKKKLTGAPCESNIKTIGEEHISSGNNFTFWYCDRWWHKPSAASQQTVKQIEVTQEVVSPELSKLNE